MNRKIIISQILVHLVLLTSCKLFSAVADEINKNYPITFSCSIASDLAEDIAGNPCNISPSDYNHSAARYYFFNSLSPAAINDGIINYFSYIVHRPSDIGTLAFGEEYVQWKMDTETFALERVRLSSIFSNSTGKGTVLSMNLFFAPSYVAIYNDDSQFSYAVLEEDSSTITYVYFYNVGKKENLVFEDKYKPEKKLDESDFSGNIIRGSYNMYLYYGEKGK